MIKMPALAKAFEDLGFEEVRTYVQSGNVIFSSEISDLGTLEKRIHDRIYKDFSFQIPVIVLNDKYLSTIQENNPFLKRKEIDLKMLYVTFLAEEPEKENIDKINSAQYLPDEFIMDKMAVYLYCPGGYGNTKLNNNFFENKLKVTATTRNWNTVNKLVELI